MGRRVVLTGAGLITPLGDSPRRLHEQLCQGASGLRPLTLFATEGSAGCPAGEISGFAPGTYLGNRNTRPLDRAAQLAASAAALALADSGWSADDRRAHAVGLVLGTMFSSLHTICEFDQRALQLGPEYASPLDFANTVLNAAAGQVAIWHDLHGVNATIGAGIASGLQAIAYAAGLVARGAADAVLAGGAEQLSFEALHALDRAGLVASPPAGGGRPVPFDACRNGIAPAESAALVMLEAADAAERRGAKIIGEIRGYGSACGARWPGAAGTADETIAQAVEAALEDAGVTPDEIDAVSASANGGLDDASEARTLKAVFGGRARALPVSAIKSMLGESLGASGAIQVIAMLESMQDGRLPGIPQLQLPEEDWTPLEIRSDTRAAGIRIALVTSLGRPGSCCALVLASPAVV